MGRLGWAEEPLEERNREERRRRVGRKNDDDSESANLATGEVSKTL